MDYKKLAKKHNWKELMNTESLKDLSPGEKEIFVTAALRSNELTHGLQLIKKETGQNFTIYRAFFLSLLGKTKQAQKILDKLKNTLKGEHEAFYLFVKGYLLSLTLNQRSAQKTLEKALGLVKGKKDNLLRDRIKAAMAISDIRRSFFKEANIICRELIDNPGTSPEFRGTAYRYLGIIHSYSYNYYDAISYYNLALNEFRRINDLRGLMKTFTSLGFTYINMGDLELGEFFSHKALEIARGSDCLLNQGKISNRLGNLYILRGENEKAMEAFKKDLKISIELENPTLVGFSLRNIGRLLKIQGDNREAREYLEKGLSAFSQCQDNVNELITKMELLELEAENLNKLQLLEKFNSLLNGKGIKTSVELRGNFQIKFARICMDKNFYEMAEGALLSAEKLLSKKQNVFRYVEVLFSLGKLYHLKNETEKSKTYLKSAYEMTNEKSIDFLQREIINLLGEIDPDSVMEISRDMIMEREGVRNVISLERDRVLESFNDYYIVGTSRKIKSVINKAKRFAQSNGNILLRGETGIGKEIFASYIHHCSKRRNGPFVVLNCGIQGSTDILRSSLFGYKKGAFTGADKDSDGKAKAATSGTLFIDEIDKMDISVQGMLLRLLEQQEIEPVGAVMPEKVDVRIVLATNKNLQKLVEEGHFLRDLLNRLTLVVEIPALRERREDIVALTHYFVKKHAQENNIEVNGIEERAIDFLKLGNWPGNVRELSNTIMSAVLQLSGKTLTYSQIVNSGYSWKEKMPSLEEVKKDYVKLVLEHTKGNRSKAAMILGIHRNSIPNILEE